MFRAPEYLWLILIPLAIAALSGLRRAKAAADAAGEAALRDHSGNWRGQSSHGKVAFFPAVGGGVELPPLPWRLTAGLIFVVVALARPQWGPETRPTIQSGTDILIAIDLSRSMAAADVAPSRLERAKQVAADLIRHLPGERVGLIVFSGVAILQAPLSLDHDALLEFLPALQIDTGPEGGTNFQNLFQSAAEDFGLARDSAKDLIILSDGEANDPHWSDHLGLLESAGIAVVGLGIGTPAGSTLPDGAGGAFRDASGGVVVSHLEDGNLAQIAARTHGVYVDASFNFDAAKAARAIVAQATSGRRVGGTGVAALKERFQAFLALGALFIAWSLWQELPVRLRWIDRGRHAPVRSRVSQGAALALIMALAAGTPARAQMDEDLSDTLGEQLHSVVAQLAVKRPLRAPDFAVLAGMTVGYGRWRRAAHHPLNAGILLDGLAAVSAGRALDPKAADWGALQVSLRALMQVPPSPPPPPPPPQDQSLAHPPPPNPEELALLEKLLRVREQDSAVRLYHLLHPPVAGDATGKNW